MSDMKPMERIDYDVMAKQLIAPLNVPASETIVAWVSGAILGIATAAAEAQREACATSCDIDFDGDESAIAAMMALEAEHE